MTTRSHNNIWVVQVQFYLYHQVLIKVGVAVPTGSGVYIGSFNKKGYNASDWMHS